MKEVIDNQEKSTVQISEVSEDKYYGVLGAPDYKGFISRTEYSRGEFIALCASGVTRRNAWDLIPRSASLPVYIQTLKKHFKVFEFDSPKELFAWLAE